MVSFREGLFSEGERPREPRDGEPATPAETNAREANLLRARMSSRAIQGQIDAERNIAARKDTCPPDQLSTSHSTTGSDKSARHVA